MNSIEIEALSFGYEKKSEIIHLLTTAIPSGEITIIAGPNGSGKSTLLKLIAGFEKQWSGSIKINSNQSEEKLSKKLSIVPQSRNIPDTTVERLVLAGRFPHTKFPHNYSKADYNEAENAMKKMGILDFAHKDLSDLSGGQRQKVYIAMALAQNTPIMLFDEPLTYLDIRQQLELIEILKELKEEGKTILLIVHDLNIALTVADNLILMDQGRIIAQGSPAKIAESGLIDKVFGVKTEILGSKFGDKFFFTI